jgi:hypothetical protein
VEGTAQFSNHLLELFYRRECLSVQSYCRQLCAVSEPLSQQMSEDSKRVAFRRLWQCREYIHPNFRL